MLLKIKTFSQKFMIKMLNLKDLFFRNHNFISYLDINIIILIFLNYKINWIYF